ncbi:class I SAM-dependent methyltransferase [Sinimarinibacterium thermocellulolyticum]|uniref:Ribosomal RNA small subunit methyltransferase J n=1 Tax=Sinimarinibacterium thermocellulolyticum TaxID=3170016 RepID=A0ABV2AA74_9GAMM
MPKQYPETPGLAARGFAFALEPTDEGLQLRARHRPKYAPLRIDWTSREQRRRVAGGKKQLLARAIGLHKHADLHVLDATGGLGRDAWTLAALGARVDLVERQPLLAALLRDAHTRALADPQHAATAQRLQVIEADAAVVLGGDARWDVVHLDPMYPDHGRHALPQREMQLLRELVGDDADADALLAPARAACRLRTVVKRQLHAPHLGDQAPDFQLAGTQARYDVYLAR